MDCVDIQGGGARSIDCFILFAWQTGDLMWLVSRRSVSDGARRDCYRWQDTDTSQSLAVNLSCSASTTCSTSEPYLKILRVQCIISLRPPKKSPIPNTGFPTSWGSERQVPIREWRKPMRACQQVLTPDAGEDLQRKILAGCLKMEKGWGRPQIWFGGKKTKWMPWQPDASLLLLTFIMSKWKTRVCEV